jgi:hypothetical protein
VFNTDITQVLFMDNSLGHFILLPILEKSELILGFGNTYFSTYDAESIGFIEPFL